MLSGLYGDLPEAKNNASASGSTGGGWAAKPKFAPAARKPVLGAPRSVLGAARKRPREPEGKDAAANSLTPLPGTPSVGVLGTSVKDERLQDEYDPARPNEYETVRKERERLKQAAQQEADRQEELAFAQEIDNDINRRERSSEDREAALALSGEEAFLRRARLGKAALGRESADSAAADLGPSLAQRMMEKMGWKEGLGLGKSHQGIVSPLVAKKTDHRSAVIVNAPRPGGEEGGPPAEKRAKGVSIQGTPSRVVLLRNIVGPGDVDASLDDEIGEECSKYGQISQITIFEVTEPGYPPEQAVRIFVQFERMESAMKALIDLEGRFFGGRTVRATFFSEQRFEAQDLAPDPSRPD